MKEDDYGFSTIIVPYTNSIFEAQTTKTIRVQMNKKPKVKPTNKSVAKFTLMFAKTTKKSDLDIQSDSKSSTHLSSTKEGKIIKKAKSAEPEDLSLNLAGVDSILINENYDDEDYQLTFEDNQENAKDKKGNKKKNQNQKNHKPDDEDEEEENEESSDLNDGENQEEESASEKDENENTEEEEEETSEDDYDEEEDEYEDGSGSGSGSGDGDYDEDEYYDEYEDYEDESEDEDSGKGKNKNKNKENSLVLPGLLTTKSNQPKIPNPCEPNPCNSGKCEKEETGGYKCRCPPGAYGRRCHLCNLIRFLILFISN
jgi:hypothetical protein